MPPSVAEDRPVHEEVRERPPATVVVPAMKAVTVEEARSIVGAKNCLATCSG